MKGTTHTTSPSPVPVEWNLPEGVDLFSEGHVYHAYRTGINEGLNQDQKLIDKLIFDNSVKAGDNTFAVIKTMKDFGITPLSAHLKIESPYAVKVLITISNEDFIKESFEKLYEKINEIQRASKSDFYSIAFTFINRSEKFDEELVQLDGYL